MTVYPRGLFVHRSLLQQFEMSHNIAFQCFHWISVEADGRMGTDVIFLSPLCIIMYVRFAGSKIKCYFYLEDLQKQNVEKKKIQAFCYFSMFPWRKGAMGLFL